MKDFWKSLEKIVLFLLTFFLLVCGIGGACTLFYCDIEGSNFFAVGILWLVAEFIWSNWNWFKKEFLAAEDKV